MRKTVVTGPDRVFDRDTWSAERIRDYAYLLGIPEEGFVEVLRDVAPRGRMAVDHMALLDDAVIRAYPDIFRNRDGIAARADELKAKRKPKQDTMPLLSELRRYLKRKQRVRPA